MHLVRTFARYGPQCCASGFSSVFKIRYFVLQGDFVRLMKPIYPTMKLQSLFSALLFTATVASAQTTAVVSPAPDQQVSIAVTPFGLDQKVTIGSADKTGKVTMNFDQDFGKLSESVENSSWITISELLGFCDNADELFAGGNELEALEPGPLFFFNKEELFGFIILISDTALYKWVIDPSEGTAVPGSYFETVYVHKNFAYTGHCEQTADVGSGDVSTLFEMELNLKTGLNFIEYKIESVHENSDPEAVSIPKIIRVMSQVDFPAHAMLVGYYF